MEGESSNTINSTTTPTNSIINPLDNSNETSENPWSSWGGLTLPNLSQSSTTYLNDLLREFYSNKQIT